MIDLNQQMWRYLDMRMCRFLSNTTHKMLGTLLPNGTVWLVPRPQQ